jgi:hypothetical protein
MKLLNLALLSLSILTITSCPAQRDDGAFMLWDQLLSKYVDNDGVVQYAKIKADPSFERCISTFSAMKVSPEWKPEMELCYWINVYNAFTIKLICDHYPLKSITDIKDPWKQKFITLNGEKFSLDQIENEILRPKFKDPRVHFAINCASISCPKLNNRAFFPESLNKMLDKLAKGFVNDPTRNVLAKDKIQISKIFEWFSDDFSARGGLTGYINRFANEQVDPEATIEFLDYNWNLNGK